MGTSESGVLMKFTGDIQRYCDVISNILNIDVYIVDEKFNTIAYSLLYPNDLIESNISHHVGLFVEALAISPTIEMRYKNTAVACRHCAYRDSCNMRFQISVPIYTDRGELLGLIGLIGVTAEQEQFVQSKKELVFHFLRQLSELIASKGTLFMDYTKQAEFIAQLSFILNRVDEGVIIYDRNYCIVQSNESARQILQLKDAAASGEAAFTSGRPPGSAADRPDQRGSGGGTPENEERLPHPAAGRGYNRRSGSTEEENRRQPLGIPQPHGRADLSGQRAAHAPPGAEAGGAA